MSALARIELEDVRTELAKAHEAALLMGTEHEADEVDGATDQDGDEWVEYVSFYDSIYIRCSMKVEQ